MKVVTLATHENSRNKNISHPSYSLLLFIKISPMLLFFLEKV